MLCLVVALPAEARPLVDRFKLKALAGHPYRLYAGPDTHLITSGIGKVASAAAVAYLRALIGPTPAAWLNVGIAGHAQAMVGTALLAHKVLDVGGGKSYYPVFAAPPLCSTDLLHTVDQPESDYGTGGAYDMEASGFCATALRFASAELVHCLKIISDNPNSSWRDLNARTISQLIAAQFEKTEAVGRAMAALARELAARQADPCELAEILARWRFTATQQHRLRDLLQRWQILAPGQTMLDGELSSLRDRGAVLDHIAGRLREIDLNLGR